MTKGVPTTSTYDELEQFFSTYGPIEHIRVTPSSFAEILFQNKQDANNLIAMNGQLLYDTKTLALKGKTKPKPKQKEQQIGGPPVLPAPPKEKVVFRELFQYPSEKRQYTIGELEKRLDHRYYTDPKRLMVAGMNGKTAKKQYTKDWEYYKGLNNDQLILNTTFPSAYFALPEHYTITITDNMQMVQEWIETNITSDCKCVGIDTENDLIRYEHVDIPGDAQRHGMPDLITISTENAGLLIQTDCYSNGEEPVQQNVHENLINLLSNPDIKKIFFGTEGDLKKIVRWLSARFSHQENVVQFVDSALANQDSMGYVDLQAIEELPWKGVKMCCSRVLGLHAEKSGEATFSRWSRRVLQESQKQYAAQDALITLLVYKRWQEYLSNKN
jgi:hypothetical protein